MDDDEPVDFFALFSLVAGSVYGRQLALGELIGQRPWSLDLDEGLLRWGDDLEFTIQLLGSESDRGTWLWAWANEQSELPEHVLEAVRELRELGEQEGIVELTTPLLELEDGLTAFQLAAVASQQLGGYASVRAPYEGGAAYLLVTGLDPARLRRPPELAWSTIAQTIEALEVHAPTMVYGFLTDEGFELEVPETGPVTAHHPSGTLVIHFDEQDRLVRLEGTLAAGGD